MLCMGFEPLNIQRRQIYRVMAIARFINCLHVVVVRKFPVHNKCILSLKKFYRQRIELMDTQNTVRIDHFCSNQSFLFERSFLYKSIILFELIIFVRINHFLFESIIFCSNRSCLFYVKLLFYSVLRNCTCK